MLQDLRSSVRALIAQPGWTMAALMCLAIAIGASTAAFSLVDGLLWRPLPFSHPDQLVMVALKPPAQPSTRPFALDEYRALAERSEPAVRLLARTFFPLSLATADGARMAEAEFVSANYFETLGISPALGRFFEAREDRPAEAPVLVLSDRLWRDRFHADPAVVGRQVRVNGLSARVLGVAPPGFVGATSLVAADLWLPAAIYPRLADSASANAVPMLGVIGRLSAGMTITQASARLNATAATAIEPGPRAGARPPAVIVSRAAGFGVPPAVEGPVLGLSAFIYLMVALVIAVACANVAALFLARGVRRRREIAIRRSLGASRLQIARFLLIESVMLSMIGAALAGPIAVWLTQAMVSSLSTPFQYVSYAIDVHPGARVLICVVLSSLLAAGLCSLAPIRFAARTEAVDAMRSAAASPSGATSRGLRTIVVLQFAISTALLAGAGMLVHTYLRTAASRPSYHHAGIVTAELDLTQVRASGRESVRFYEDLLRRLSTRPDIASLALTQTLPGHAGEAVHVVPQDGTFASRPTPASAGIVSSGYFEVLGITALQGRTFDARDRDPGGPPIAIVNAEMAKRFWPHTSPIGQRFTLDRASDQAMTVIGVVPDLTNPGSLAPTAMFYRPFPQTYAAHLTVLVRPRNQSPALFGEIRHTVRQMDPDLSIVDLRTLDARQAITTSQRRVPALILTMLGVLGLVLSVLGLFGVVSYGVRARSRELGIRLAIGARPADVRNLILRQGSRMIVTGLLLGLLAAAGVAAVIRTVLFGVLPLDALTLVGACALLAGVGMLALLLPARAASRIDPAHVLHSE